MEPTYTVRILFDTDKWGKAEVVKSKIKSNLVNHLLNYFNGGVIQVINVKIGKQFKTIYDNRIGRSDYIHK